MRGWGAPAPRRRAWPGLVLSVTAHGLLLGAVVAVHLRTPPADAPVTIEIALEAAPPAEPETPAVVEPEAVAEAPTPPQPEPAPPEDPREPTPPDAPPPDPPPLEAPPPERPTPETAPPGKPPPLPDLPPPPDNVPLPPPPATPPPPPAAPPRPRPRPPVARATAEAPAPTAPATPPAAAPAAAAVISTSWRGALAAWLHRHKHYPPAARQRGEQGSTGVRFTVERDGRVSAVTIAASSGSALLDDAVLALLTGAQVPPFPTDMPQERITVTVQIRYSLETR